MRQGSGIVDTLLGAGFRIGFLVAIVGVFIMYLPLLDTRLMPTLDLMGVWDRVQTLPVWVQLILLGLVFIGVALSIASGKFLLEGMIDILLGKDEEPRY